MDIIEKKTVDMLTNESVSILTQKFIEVDGVETQVGENHRCAYVNSESGRIKIQKEQPKEVVNSVFAIWGNIPTIVEPKVEEAEISDNSTEQSNEEAQ